MTVLLLVDPAKGSETDLRQLDSRDVTVKHGDEEMVLHAMSGAEFSDRAS